MKGGLNYEDEETEDYSKMTKPVFIKISEHIDFTELLGEGNDKLTTNTGVS